MSESESPAQQAARLRRERREAKIKDGGAARLNKITNLSGRGNHHDSTTPQPTSMIASPQPVPTTTTSTATPTATPPNPTVQDDNSFEPDLQDLQTQEQFRALLRQAAPAQGQQQQQQPSNPTQALGPSDEDPAVKLLHSLIGGNLPDDGNAAAAAAGGGSGATQADLLSALGVPPLLADMAGAATRTPTAQEKREAALWKTIHLVFAVVMGLYVLVMIGRGIATYGNPPPPPATARNPFLVFLTGELVLSSTRLLFQSGGGSSGILARVSQCSTMVGDVVRDGSLVVFVMGIGTLLSAS